MSTITITVTGSVPTSVVPLRQLESAGEGRPLGNSSSEAPTGPRLSVARSVELQERIERLNVFGAQTKISSLKKAIEQNRFCQEANNWLAEFEAIDSEELEAQVYALAILVHRVIYPELENRNLAEQGELLEWDDLCRDVLMQLLGGANEADLFLEDCAEGLAEEILFQKRCERMSSVANMQMDAIAKETRELNNKLKEKTDSLKSQISDLQEKRKAFLKKIDPEIDQIAENIDSVAQQILDKAKEISNLDAGDDQYKKSLERCQQILEEL